MWTTAKALHEPLDKSFKHISDIPYTISFVIRKRIQVDNFNEMEKEKRPPEKMIWFGSSKEIDEWIDKVYKRHEPQNVELSISDSEIE